MDQSPKEIVTSLMTFEGREMRKVNENVKEVERVFLKYRCPKPQCAIGVIEFLSLIHI